jgi:hypothetical protein
MREIEKKVLTMSSDELSQAYKTVFGSPDANIVLEDLKNRCYVKVSSAWPNTDAPVNDALTTYINEGMRALYLYIENQINYEPEQKKEEVDNV